MSTQNRMMREWVALQEPNNALYELMESWMVDQAARFMQNNPESDDVPVDFDLPDDIHIIAVEPGRFEHQPAVLFWVQDYDNMGLQEADFYVVAKAVYQSKAGQDQYFVGDWEIIYLDSESPKRKWKSTR